MPKWLLITALLLTTCVAGAQNAAIIDSLEKELKSSMGVSRTDVLIELGWELKYRNPDSSTRLTEEALSLAKAQSYTKGLALANRNMAAILIIQGKSREGLAYAEKALDYIKSTSDDFQKGKILNLLGIIHRDLKNYKNALNFQNQSLLIFRQLKDTFELAGNLNNLGLIYKQLGNREEALRLYLEVFEIEQRKKNASGISRTSNNLAAIYQEIGKFELAERMYKLSIQTAHDAQNLQFEAASIHGLGLLYQQNNLPDKAIHEYKKAIEINKKAGFYEFLGNNLVQLAGVYETIGNYNEALTTFSYALEVYISIDSPWQQAVALNGMSVQQRNLRNYPKAKELAEQAHVIADSLKDINSLAIIHLNLYKINKETGLQSKALGHLEEYLILYDSIKISENSQLLEEIQTRYEVKNIEADNSRLKAENLYQLQVIRSQRVAAAGIILAFILISVLAIAISLGRKRLRKANNELIRKNEEILKQSELLHASNATKDKLFSIIAHDIRNPFAALLNLSEMLNEEVDTADKETLRFYANNIHQSASNTFQLLDNLLYWSKSQRGTIELKPEECNLNKITAEVFSTAQAGALENNISLNNEIYPETSLRTDMTLLRIVLGNLIGNAVKFNNPGGSITVSSSTEQDKIIILIKDTGKGIAPERINQIFDKEESFQPSGSRTKNGTGLGLILCRDFVEKLGGDIQIASEVGQGTEFTIRLPLEKKE
ncbi:MAG: tetratricopeptide repeat-containing sensor histidine kinase [Bacteroidales bacterium]|nr:tetratricopeptide repeat-containing sensor histidine kinase [Bacteroidales bacterium]